MDTSVAMDRPVSGLERTHRIVASNDASAAREFARLTRLFHADGGPHPGGSGGLLNPSGAPVELSFVRGSADLRSTMEVCAAQTLPAQRLGVIRDLLSQIGSWDHEGGVVDEFTGMQHGHPLAWGAWLGVRQPLQQAGTAPMRYKVYAEVPPGPNATVSGWLQRYLPAPSPQAPLVMVGAAPAAQRCEFYFEWGRRRFTKQDLARWMQRVGLGHRLGELLDALGSLEFRQGREPDALPRAQYGVSCSVLPGGADPVFSVIVFAADLAGGDAWIRQRLLQQCGSAGAWALYAALTVPLAHLYFRTVFHNMLTLSVGVDAPVAWQVSLSPPTDACGG